MSQKMLWSNFRSSFQCKLFITFTLLTASISIIFCALYITSEISEKRDHAREQVHQLVQQLAESIRLPLYAEYREVLQLHAEEAARAPEIRAVVISASDGRVLAKVNFPEASTTPDMISETVEVRSSHLASSPEAAISGGHNSEGVLLGHIRIERGTQDLSRLIRKIVVVSLAMAIGSWLAVTLLCNLILRRVTRSFNALMQGIKTMQEGDYTSRIDVKSDDEPGRAADAVNSLANALQQRGEENVRLQDERLDLERQMLYAQKLESLGVMAGGIAHDYNNLLQSILGNIELASMNLAPASASQKFISNAMDSCRQAAHLTGLMLTYVGKGIIAKKELNLNELVAENIDLLRMSSSTAVSIKLSLSAELPAITADAANIQQVVMNLVINAAESIQMQSGTVRITTGIQDCDQNCLATSLLEEKPEPGRYVFLEVSDNGCGMDGETLKRLFDPFFTTKFTGRGLGMSAVLGIIRTHGGALFVKSEPGKGTTFRVLFPTSGATTPANVQVSAPAAIVEKAVTGLALVVDDEKAVLKVCATMVKHCGYTVITACDGVDAVAKFREHADEIVVVLMDLVMPNMDGITAMGEIYDIRPAARVIISSGFNEEELSGRITSVAPSGFIRKPYSVNLLQTEIQRVMMAV